MRGFALAPGRRLACFVRPHQNRGKVRPPPLAIAIFGLLGSHYYFRWMLATGIHKSALVSIGEVGYWFWNLLPAIALFLPLLFVVSRFSFVRNSLVGVPLAALAALLICWLGLYGEFLFCVFVLRGICE